MQGDLTSLKQDLTSVKQDLTSLKQDLSSVKQDVATMEDRIMARVDGRLDAVASRMKDLSGALFSPSRRQSLGESAALNERMLNVEDRVSALQRRPSEPPAVIHEVVAFTTGFPSAFPHGR